MNNKYYIIILIVFIMFLYANFIIGVFGYEKEMNKGIELLRQGETVKARQCFLKALSSIPSEDFLLRARGYKYIGNCFFMDKDLESALKNYLTSVEILEQGQKWEDIIEKDSGGNGGNSGDREIILELCRVYNNMAKLEDTRDEWEKAVKYYKICIKIDSYIKSPDLAEDYINLGYIYFKMGDYSNSEDNYNKAEPLLPAHHDHVFLVNARFYYNRGVLRDKMYRYKEALKDGEKALNYFEKDTGRQGKEGRGRSLLLIGNLERKLGDTDRAYKNVLLALKIFESIYSPLETAGCYNDLGLICEDLKDTENAKKYYSKSIEIYKNLYQNKINPCTENLARAYNNMANIIMEKKNYHQALTLYKESLALRMDKGDPLFIAGSYNNLGLLTERMGNLAEGISYYQEGRKIIEKDTSPSALLLYANIENNLGVIFLKQKHYSLAVESFTKSKDIFTAIQNLPGMSDTYSNLGFCFLQLKEPDKALQSFQQSLDIGENLRSRLSTPRSRAIFMEDKLFIYEKVIYLLIKKGNYEEAFSYIERAKARAFLDMVGNREMVLSENHPREIIELLEKERELSATLEEMMQISSPGLSNRLRDYNDILSKIKKIYPEYTTIKTIDISSLDEVQSLIDHDTVILEYFVGAENIFLFVITKKDRIKKVYDLSDISSITAEQLLDDVRELRNVLRYQSLRNPRWQALLNKLYKILIEPAEYDIKDYKRLVLVPHGLLHHLPFSALVTQTDPHADKKISPQPRYLIESHAIIYLPSVSVLKYCRNKNNNKSDNKLIMAKSSFQGVWHALPNTGKEALEISRLFPQSTLLMEEKATPSILRDKGKDYSIIHLATHGELNTENPLKSRIILSDGKGNGELTVSQIFNLRLSASLVMLSACETGLSRINPGDDLIGLSRSFIFAGASTVGATLWEVQDETTRLLMVEFYKMKIGETAMNPSSEPVSVVILFLLS